MQVGFLEQETDLKKIAHMSCHWTDLVQLVKFNAMVGSFKRCPFSWKYSDDSPKNLFSPLEIQSSYIFIGIIYFKLSRKTECLKE